jgi:hypothetical protein
MTKKRHTKKRKHTTTRRKVGAVSTLGKRHVAKRRTSRRKVGAISMTGEIILGAIGGSLVTRLIMKNLPDPTIDSTTKKVDPNKFDYRPYTGLAVGAAAEYFGKKNLLVRAMGIGAIVEGARSVIQDKYIPSLNSSTDTTTGTGVKGLPYTTGMQTRMIAAPKKLRSLAGTSNTGGLAGIKNGLAGNDMATNNLYNYGASC